MTSVSAFATKQDLVGDARKAGLPFTVRTVGDWVEQGLLAPPRRRGAGRGKGAQPAVFPPNQRRLFNELVKKRILGAKIPRLAQIPLYLWAYWGDEYVDTAQARRAMRTALGWRPNLELAQEHATEMVDQIAHPDATDTARRRLARLCRDIANTAKVARPEEVRAALLCVFDPHKEGRTLGVPGAAASIGNIFGAMLRKEAARRAFLDDAVCDDVLRRARGELKASLMEFYQQQPEFAAQAAAANLRIDYSLPMPQRLVDSLVGDLLLIVGTLLIPSLPLPEGSSR